MPLVNNQNPNNIHGIPPQHNLLAAEQPLAAEPQISRLPNSNRNVSYPATVVDPDLSQVRSSIAMPAAEEIDYSDLNILFHENPPANAEAINQAALSIIGSNAQPQDNEEQNIEVDEQQSPQNSQAEEAAVSPPQAPQDQEQSPSPVPLAQGQQSSPVNEQQPQGVQGTQQVTLATIRDKLDKSTSSTPSQALLADVIKDLKSLPEYQGKEFVIEAELDKNNKNDYTPEPYVSPKDIDKQTYYKIGVTYTIKLKDPDANLPPLGDLSMKREIFTRSRTPENAILVATNFKETITKIATSQNDPDLLNAKAFQFDYNQDASGKPLMLEAIKGLVMIEGRNGLEVSKRVEMQNVTQNYDASKVYLHDLKTGEVKQVDVAGDEYRNRRLGNHAVYKTREEWLIHSRCSVNTNKYYEKLEQNKEKNFEEQIQLIKDEAKKKDREFAETKKLFFEKPILRLFRKEAKTKKEFEQFLALKNYEKDASELSPNMIEFLNKKKELQKLNEGKVREELNLLNRYKQLNSPTPANQASQPVQEDQALAALAPEGQAEPDQEASSQASPAEQDQVAAPISPAIPPLSNENQQKVMNLLKNVDLDTLIKQKENELGKINKMKQGVQDLQQAVRSEQAIFNEGFSNLRSYNQELRDEVSKLEALRTEAIKIINDPSISSSDERKKQAKWVKNHISETSIKKLNEKIKANEVLIDKIISRLSLVGADIAEKAISLEVGETLEEVSLAAENQNHVV